MPFLRDDNAEDNEEDRNEACNDDLTLVNTDGLGVLVCGSRLHEETVTATVGGVGVGTGAFFEGFLDETTRIDPRKRCKTQNECIMSHDYGLCRKPFIAITDKYDEMHARSTPFNPISN